MKKMLKKHKYNARKVEFNNIKFDSKKEAKRYLELIALQKAGVIKDLELQPAFLLQESFKYQGKLQRAIKYIADFKYVDVKTGKVIVEDVKGFKTDVYKLKKKMFLKKYSEIEFKEI